MARKIKLDPNIPCQSKILFPNKKQNIRIKTGSSAKIKDNKEKKEIST